MTLFRLIERNVALRPLSSTLTALNVALGVMLVATILVLRSELKSSYERQGKGYAFVVGPPSAARLQLVLDNVYHVPDQSSGLLPFRVLHELEQGEYRRLIRLALPYAVGDSYRGHRVVATTDALFSSVFPFPPGEKQAKLAEGRPFRFDDEALQEAIAAMEARAAGGAGGTTPAETDHETAHDHEEHANEAVLGAEAAETLGLRIGDAFEPTHGVEGAKAHEHEHLWTVVGILKRSGNPIDRVIFINLDSFYRIEEHEKGGTIPGTGEPAISSLLVFPAPGFAKARLLGLLAKRSDLVAADVVDEVRRLIGIVGDVDRIFFVIAILVVLIGVVSLLVAIYNTMNERRRELAILRAIGARRATVVAGIVGEAGLLTFIGAAAGLFLAHLLLAAGAGYLERRTGLRVDPWRLVPQEPALAVVVTLVGALAGFLPAWKAYRTDVARNLSPLS